MDNVEIDLFDLAEKVFTKLPEAPKSIPIMFEDLGLKELFEALLTFLVEGLKIRYPSKDEGKVDLHLLTEDDLKRINEYMNSIGFLVNIDIVTLGEWIVGKGATYVDYSNIVVSNKTKLNELKCKFVVYEKIYVVNFDYI